MKIKKISLFVVVILLLTFATACDKVAVKPEGTNTPTPSTIAVEQIAESTDIKGEVITTNLLENVVGGYSIPVNDSWLGKTSVEFDGTRTYIYHITQDANEMEINPLLWHINVSEDPSADSLAAEVYFDIDGLKYYYIPRFDFPYNEGSADAIEFAEFTEDIPQLMQSVWLLDGSIWDEYMFGTATGIILRENYVYSSFFVAYVPESWIGKVSYVDEGNQISFYHITQDASQMEINPLIMTLDVADGVLDGGVEETYVSDGYTFFYVPRFDFPYSDTECADGAEFAALYADARTVLESCTTRTTPSPGHASTFMGSDARIGEAYIGESKEIVLAKIDEEPIEVLELVWEATGEVEESYEFSFGTLFFLDGMFEDANITDSSIYGPRDITVGMSLNDIVEIFTSAVEKETDDKIIYYRANSGSDEDIEVPSFGMLLKADKNILRYGCFYDESEVEGMTIEELEYEFWFFTQYSCAFYFDENDILESYSVGLSFPAE